MVCIFNCYFSEFPEETWGKRLVLFQEAIAIKFGFIACSVKSTNHHQYIHLTGNILKIIFTNKMLSSLNFQIKYYIELG